MTRFTLKRVFAIIALLAADLGAVAPIISPNAEFLSIRGTSLVVVGWLAIGGAVGAAILWPFKLAYAGAVIGILVNFVIVIAGIAEHTIH
jgi:hypothetical protein